MDLILPVKRLSEAKTRLRGTAADDATHARLALALAHDTVAAARAAHEVRRMLVVTSDPTVAAEFAAIGVEVAAEGAEPGLNAAFTRGAALLRERDPGAPVAALQADLPALRPAELDAAVVVARARFATGTRRVFCTDTEGTGTTLLLAAGGADLDPRFGIGSAVAHAGSGARALTGEWPGLRRDVDTSDDLRAAAALGLGEHTRTVLALESTATGRVPHGRRIV